MVPENGIYVLGRQWLLQRQEPASKWSYLFNVATGEVFRLNSLAYEMLDHFTGDKTVNEIAHSIASRFSADYDRVVKDLVAFVWNCVTIGILVPKESSNGT